MSSKSGQSSELRDVLARIQNAKTNKVNVERRVRRATTALEQARADLVAADAELKESDSLLMGALRKGMTGALKDRDLALAIAETIANAQDGGGTNQFEGQGGDGGQQRQQEAQLPLDGQGSEGPDSEDGEEDETGSAEADTRSEQSSPEADARSEQPRQQPPVQRAPVDIEGLASQLPSASNAA